MVYKMNLFVSNRQSYNPLTPEACDEAITQITQATIDSVKAVLTILVQSQQLDAHEFVAKQIAPVEHEMRSVDLRTHCFMLNMVVVISEELDKLGGMNEGFKKLAEETHDRKIRDKFIQSVALPRVKSLIGSLDRINPQIVDKLIHPIPLQLRIKAIVRIIRNLFSC